MKPFLIVAGAAAFFGGVLGCFGGYWLSAVHFMTPTRIEAREFVLLDEHSEAVARLATSNGRTVLRLSRKGSPVALEVGIDTGHSERFIHFLGKDDSIVAALNSSEPQGAATLYLGDEVWETRAVFGALRGDVEPARNVDTWGLTIHAPGALSPLFGILAKPVGGSTAWAAGLRLVQPNGEVWGKPGTDGP